MTQITDENYKTLMDNSMMVGQIRAVMGAAEDVLKRCGDDRKIAIMSKESAYDTIKKIIVDGIVPWKEG